MLQRIKIPSLINSCYKSNSENNKNIEKERSRKGMIIILGDMISIYEKKNINVLKYSDEKSEQASSFLSPYVPQSQEFSFDYYCSLKKE
jgi:hypothetical protein